MCIRDSQKDKADTPAFFHPDEAVVVPKSLERSALPHGLCHLAGAPVIHGGDLPGVAAEYLPRLIQQNREKAGFKGSLRREPPPRVKQAIRLSGSVLPRKGLGKGTLVLTCLLYTSQMARGTFLK